MQKKEITRVAAAVHSKAPEFRHTTSNGPSKGRRSCASEVFGVVLPYPPNRSVVTARENKTPAAFLADLAEENAGLRHRVVELALQVHDLLERPLRSPRS